MFNGTLVKVGNYTIPPRYIRQDSYKCTYSTLDLDSYRDANGELHRTALEHKIAKVEFNLICMDNATMNSILSNIRSNYTDAKEKKATVTYYINETDSYATESMYIPDISFTIRNITDNVVNYAETRLAFIGY